MIAKQYKLYFIFVLGYLALWISNESMAANFTLSVTQGTSLPTTVAAGGTAYACYTIRNNTHQTLSGYSVVTDTNILVDSLSSHCPTPLCPNPLSITAQTSCNQQLNITGPVTNYYFGIAKGSSVTKTNNIPLNVSIGQRTIGYAYIPSSSDNTVTLCDIGDRTGELTCQGTTGAQSFDTPFAVAVHPSGRFAYVTNYNDNSINLCNINSQTGALNCSSTTVSGFNGPLQMALNPSGTLAYVTNYLNNNVMKNLNLLYQNKVYYCDQKIYQIIYMVFYF